MKGLLGRIAALVALGASSALPEYKAPASVHIPLPDFGPHPGGTPRRRFRRPAGTPRQRFAYPPLMVRDPLRGIFVWTIAGYDRAMSQWLDAGRVGERPVR